SAYNTAGKFIFTLKQSAFQIVCNTKIHDFMIPVRIHCFKKKRAHTMSAKNKRCLRTRMKQSQRMKRAYS
ncbi:MAG: hypothetical protein FWF86_08590, partial [Clostridia bacterium]|nr:hypothetical protein [Clostridia bacterium]